MRYRFDAFELYVPERELRRDGALLAVEPKVFDLLCYLVGHRDRAIGRDELIAAVWGRVDLADNTLAQAVLRLRRVLEDNGTAPRYLRTLPRHGYRWITATVEVAAVGRSAVAVEPALHPHRKANPDSVSASPDETTTNAMPSRAAALRVPWLRRAVPIALPLALAVLLIALFVAWRWPQFASHVTPNTLGDIETTATVSPTPADPLGAALQARAQGRVRDAYEQLSRLYQARPDAAELLVDLAGSECALEMVQACKSHLASALAAPQLPASARVAAHLELARRYLIERDAGRAVVETDAAATAANGSRDALLLADIVRMRQRIASAGGDTAVALALAQRAMTLYRTAGDRAAQADVEHSLGLLANRNGNSAEALAAFDRALAIFRALGDRAGEASALASRAHALGHLGRFAEADTAARAAVAAAAAQQTPAVIRDALDSQAWALLQTGHLGEARETVHRALALGASTQSPRQAMQLHSLLGFIEAAGGRFPPAIAAWDEALAVAPADGAERDTIGIRLALVYACLNAGERQRAMEEARRLRATATDAAVETIQYADHADALIAAAAGDGDRAAALFAQVWASARRTGTLNQQMLVDYADVLFRRDDLAGVETLLGETTLPAREGHLYLLVQARYLLRRGDVPGAQHAFDLARQQIGERYAAELDTARDELLASRAVPQKD